MQGGRRSTKDVWERRSCCSVHQGLGGCSMGISALSRITCSAVCEAGAGQGFLPCLQLCRCPRAQPWGRTVSKVMDRAGEQLLQPAWASGVWLLEAGEHGMLMGHACCHLSPRQERLSVVKSCGISDQKPPFHHTEVLFMKESSLYLTAIRVWTDSIFCGREWYLLRSLLV